MASYRFRKNGKVQIIITRGKRSDGRPKQFYKEVTYKSDKQLEEESALFLAEIIKGNARLSESSVIENLYYHFIHEYCVNELLSEVTIARYECMYERQIEPFFANRQINKITRADVRNWVKILLVRGSKLGNPLSRKTVKNALSMLSSMYKYAISELDLVEINPCYMVKIPKTVEIDGKTVKAKGTKEKTFYTEREIITLLSLLQKEAEEGHKMHATLIFLILFTGLRTGEVMGLKWENISFDNNAIYIHNTRTINAKGKIIEKDPKSKESIRTISIPTFITKLLIELKEYQEKESELMGNEYTYTGYVAVTPKGTPHRPSNTYNWFKRFLKRNNLKDASVHDLRHTHTAMLTRIGVELIDVSNRLGHANTRITQEVYEYLFNDIDTGVSDKLDNYYQKILSESCQDKIQPL